MPKGNKKKYSIQKRDKNETQLWKDPTDIVYGQPTFWVYRDQQWFWWNHTFGEKKAWNAAVARNNRNIDVFTLTTPLEFLLMTGQNFYESFEAGVREWT